MKKKLKKSTKKKISGAKVVKISLITMAILITSVGTFLGVSFYSQTGGFSKDRLLNKEASSVVSETGKDTYWVNGKDGARKNVSYDDIPQVMIDAVIAAEDSRYFEHNGFDLPRIVKAFMGNLVAGGITGGGSTITQQVMKQSYYPNAEKENLIQGVQRKFGEIMLSIQASSEMTKEEILELYLNKIYFGYGNKAVGIYAASRYYFDKEVQELTLPEAALLAGALNSPNRFDPFRNLTAATERRNNILYLMNLHGYITDEEYEKTKKIPIENTLKSNPINNSGNYQAYVDMAIREVEEKTGYNPLETPMKIYTYMDKDMQSKLDDISNSEGYTFYDKDIQAGAVVQEAKTGRIVGVLSKRDYTAMDGTNAYHKKGVKQGGYGSVHQPGSSLKPIIAYASAFEFLDYSTAHYVHDVPLSSGTYNPKNHNGQFHGDISIENALANSWNLAAIQTYIDVKGEIGNKKMTEYLEGFGFDLTDEDESLPAGYAIGGWWQGTTPKEEAAAYAAIANGGTYIEPHTVSKIELLETGEVIDLDAQYNKEKKTAISEESAFMIRDIMTSYVKSSGSYSGLNLGLQIGAKTGTSNWDDKTSNKTLRGKSKDSWMSAFSPDYAWSVWVGYPTQLAQEKGKWLRSGRDSKNIASIIAKTIHDGKLKNSYPSKPSGIVQSSCVSGIYPYVKPGEGVPQDRVVSGWFKTGNTPSGSASGAAINNLSSFTATLANRKINVQFTPYNPESMTKDGKPTKVYKSANGKSYTLPYLGDITQIYGKVVYVVEVKDANGNVVHTEKLSAPTATLKYTPTSGQYTVTGYYAFESGNGTSNKLDQTITLEQTSASASYSVESYDKATSTLKLKVSVPTQGSTLTITYNGQTATAKHGNSTVTIPSVTEGSTLTFVETTTDGKQFTLPSYTIPVSTS